MRTLKYIFRLLTFTILIALPPVVWSQQTSTYKMDLVRSVQFTSDSQNHILAILKVTPTVKDFKMILSMKVTYEIGKNAKTIDLQRQKNNNIRITIYGKDIEQKNQKLHDLVKERVNLTTGEDIRFIVFDFTSISNEPVDNMTLIYGLWEGKNEDIRHEKTFTFKVDTID